MMEKVEKPLKACTSHFALFSSGALGAYGVYSVRRVHIIKEGKHLQAFRDVPKSHSAALSNEAEHVYVLNVD